ncbi:unnamed protein product, partial [Rotaria sp. Silwood2]
MSIVKVDNGELIIGVPIEPDGIISINTFNRLFPSATVFLFKRNRSNVWIEMATDDSGNFLAPDGVWSDDVMYKAYDARSPHRRSSQSSTSSISWNRFWSTFG